MFYPIGGNAENWTGQTLVVPAVSVGNVGQLSVDILISTLALRKVGHFYDDSFLPVVGNDPFAEHGAPSVCNLMTAAEVFSGSAHRVVVLQQRSPLVKGKRRQYVEKLMKWIKTCGFADVIILTSTFSHERLDCQLTGTQLRYLMTPDLLTSSCSLIRDQLQWKALEARGLGVGVGEERTGGGDESATDVFMPGGGVAKLLYLQCSEEKVNASVLLTFCSEGDNAGDALQLISYLNSWKQWAQDKADKGPKLGPWRIPSSWKLMYGNRFDPILFR